MNTKLIHSASSSDKAIQPTSLKMIPGENFWSWFQSEDKNRSNDYISNRGKRYVYMNEQEAKDAIEKLGLPFDQETYYKVTRQSNVHDYIGMNGSMLIRYIALMNKNLPPLKNLRQFNLNLKKDSPFLIRSITVSEKMFYKNPDFKSDIGEKTISKFNSGYSLLKSTKNGASVCEATAFSLSKMAEEEGSSIVKGAQGPLVGFLHLPGRKYLHLPSEQYSTEDKERLAAVNDVVALSMRGYFSELQYKVKNNQPLRILITGFGRYKVYNDIYTDINISGDYISSVSNIDKTMQIAFGDRLVKKTAQIIKTPLGNVLRYIIRDQKTANQTRAIDILPKKLAAENETLDSNGSLQKLVHGFKPQAAIALGQDATSTNNFSLITQPGNIRLVNLRADKIKDDTLPTKKYPAHSLAQAILTAQNSA